MTGKDAIQLESIPSGWTESRHDVTVLEKVSSTRQAVVYKAKQNSSGKLMALKISLAEDVDDVERFKREAELLNDLDHPNICPCHGGGVLQGRPFMIMEWLDGENLAEILKRRGALAPEEISKFFTGVWDALQYAHGRNIVHRDIKPSNIFVERTPDGPKARLMDFGMAKPINTNLELTPAGFVLGSPAYMSPEQCTGQDLDCRSDIYSLACVLYECLTNSKVFTGESNMDAMYKHLHEDPKPITERPGFSRIVLRGLEKSPSDRFQRVSDMRRAWENELNKDKMMLSLKSRSVFIIPVIVFVVVVIAFYLLSRK